MNQNACFPPDEHDLSDADKKTQIEVMREWFLQRYEDPAERTPYESAEGGYIWIWGGPYYPWQVLREEFEGVVPGAVIDELSNDLTLECGGEWAPKPSPDDYDDYFVDDLALITEFLKNFGEAILDIQHLLNTPVDPSVANCFYRMLFSNVITALEAYLSDAFISTVIPRSDLLRRLVETTPAFKNEKFTLSEVFQVMVGLEQKIKGHLAEIVWHRLEPIIRMYHDTLGVEFLPKRSALHSAILKRHDIVHRNGKTKDGVEILVSAQDISELIAVVELFVLNLDSQVAKIRMHAPSSESGVIDEIHDEGNLK